MTEEKPVAAYKLKPKDAATLLIIRGGEEVLMGVRSAKHAFMPNKYVFPGGRVDRADGMVPRPVDLQPGVAAKLERAASPARARALAMAAVRETFEEAGMLLAAEHDTRIRTGSPHWKPFYASGLVPALDKLEYIARAITPPGRPRRFDTRFLMVDADHLRGSVYGNGELLDLKWVKLKDAQSLDLPNITRLVIEIARRRLEDGEHRSEDGMIPFVRTVNRRHIIGDH
ncbi:NUDIX hydrolase [Iodidimonas sp. SYSU 1G8]|uniref:NUDIX hydrolase n=1 Tax=Iodidimonas sp. SYSU 1G8 TaxID=3133967 RepID=UPI0031FEE01C